MLGCRAGGLEDEPKNRTIICRIYRCIVFGSVAHYKVNVFPYGSLSYPKFFRIAARRGKKPYNETDVRIYECIAVLSEPNFKMLTV